MHIAMPFLLFLTLLVTPLPRAGTNGTQAPPTIEAELGKYGVPVTQPALQAALKDKRPEVRSLAAGELAEMRDGESTPLIVQALEREEDPLVRFNMAASLLSLDSSVGKRALLHICNNASLPVDRRLEAASRLVNVGNFDCLSSVESILRKTTEASIKVFALQILAKVKVTRASLAPEIHNTLLLSLQDHNSAVRQNASECIAALDDKAAAASLRAAIATEPDDLTKARMEESLKSLENRP